MLKGFVYVKRTTNTINMQFRPTWTWRVNLCRQWQQPNSTLPAAAPDARSPPPQSCRCSASQHLAPEQQFTALAFFSCFTSIRHANQHLTCDKMAASRTHTFVSFAVFNQKTAVLLSACSSVVQGSTDLMCCRPAERLCSHPAHCFQAGQPQERRAGCRLQSGQQAPTADQVSAHAHALPS